MRNKHIVALRPRLILSISLIGITVIGILVFSIILNTRHVGIAVVSIIANEFSLQNKDDEELTFSFGETSGGMEVIQSSRFQEDAPTLFELPYSDEYYFTSGQERTKVAIETDNWAQGFEGSGISSAKFNGNESISLEGENISATVSINYPEGEIYTPFRLSVYSENGLSVNTTDTGIEVHGISALIPLRASYHHAHNPNIQFTNVKLGSFSGSIFIDLSELESEGHLIVKTEIDGSNKTQIIDIQ